ncbi:MAG: hypothetical protein HC918_01535 [Oscillatoriales cyanobacterium SM2_1_8]|nr:hypothetical protein [Oscillatoriales cyanobacterium SM2_1_8]
MKDWLATALPFALSPSALERCDRLYQLVLAGNAQQNLTRLTAPAEFWENTSGTRCFRWRRLQSPWGR